MIALSLLVPCCPSQDDPSPLYITSIHPSIFLYRSGGELAATGGSVERAAD